VLRPKARCTCFDSRASLPALEKAKLAAVSAKQAPTAISRPVKEPSHQAVTGTAMLARRRRLRMDRRYQSACRAAMNFYSEQARQIGLIPG